MVAIPKFAGSLSCGFLLCVGLSNTVQAEHVPSASDVMKTDSATDRQGFQDDADKQMHDGMGGSAVPSISRVNCFGSKAIAITSC